MNVSDYKIVTAANPKVGFHSQRLTMTSSFAEPSAHSSLDPSKAAERFMERLRTDDPPSRTQRSHGSEILKVDEVGRVRTRREDARRCLFYRMLKFGKAYVAAGQQTYERLLKERTPRNLQRKARGLGFDVTPMASTVSVS